MKFVLVAINLPIKNLFKQFIYSVPSEIKGLEVGWRVVIPFGGQKVEGFVVKTFTEATLEQESDYTDVSKIKPIIAALDVKPWFNAEMLETALWLAKYYMCSLAEAMRLFIPGKTSIKKKPIYNADGKLIAYEYEERLQEKNLLAYQISDLGKKALNEDIWGRSKKQESALQEFAKLEDALTVKEAEDKGISAAVLRALADKDYLTRTEKRIFRNSYEKDVLKTEKLVLNEEQKVAIKTVCNCLDDKNAQQEYLLHGITGSGKTEVYLRITEHALKQGKQVLVLVPEIALTAQIVRRFQAWFQDEVAVVHSKLSQNERGDVMYKMRTGEAKVLIGVRSAVFAPFDNLGVVIIDEEHEGSYKQEERPNYNAKLVAEIRCKNAGAVLLAGSATPSLESYYKATNNEIGYLELPKRATGGVLPEVSVVDMRKELKDGNKSVLSRKLRREIISASAAEEQTIVLLNRRGYSTFVMCRDCGEALLCPHCAVGLVYHAKDNHMRCHYCGNVYPIPTECPSCKSTRIKFFGTGTQKAEEEINSLPLTTTLRMDQDSTSKKLAHEEILGDFINRKANVLLGTQMVAKGHDVPNVTLVGILSADSILNLPDFRAGERAFSLLTQAAGRAGRGDKAGKVVLQTYDPENETIMLAAKQDYLTFAKKELEFRKELNYPPYSTILKLTVWEKEETLGIKLGDEIVAFLEEFCKSQNIEDCEILGPFPGIVAKVRDLYRLNILVKANDMEIIKKALFTSKYKELKNIYFDVDPLSVI